MTLQGEGTQSNRDRSQSGHREIDLRGRLLRWYVLFGVLLLAAALILAILTRNRLEAEIQATLLGRAQTIAGQLSGIITGEILLEDAGSLHDAAGLDSSAMLLILSPSGEIVGQTTGDNELPDTSLWRVWQRAILNRAGEIDSGTFTVTDPDNNGWLVVAAASPDQAGGILIQQPRSMAFAPSRLLVQVWGIALFMFLAGGAFSWWLLSRQIIIPLERLEAYSGVVRWRGQMRADEEAQISELAQRPDQIGSLARALRAMEADINTRFVQLSTLLETGRVVASSLDLTVVIDNILDQVQNLFEIDYCAVLVLDRRADVFRVRASRGLSEGYVRQLRVAPSEPNSPSMRALRNEIPVQVSDTETDLAFAGFRPRARAEGYRSVLAIPLLTQHAPPAVLLLYKKTPYRYSYTELELASSFGDHASIAMENAALFARSDEQLQEQTRRLEAIVESLQDGLILESDSGRILYCNQRTTEWLGMSRREMRRQTSKALLRRILTTAVEPKAAQLKFANAVSGRGPRSFDLECKTNGQSRDLRIHLFDVNDAHGLLLGRGQLWQDITRDKEIDRMKSNLLSTVSHELRTPLATIKGYASTLLASDVQWDATAQKEFLKTISQETDRLAKLVKNLLDMSRIEAGLLSMNCEVYSLSDLLVEVTNGFTPSLVERLQMEIDPGMTPISMDVSRIGTVIRNLMENAVKYSPADKPIELSLAQNNGTVQFSVRDYGPGVPEGDQAKIFDRFFRADDPLTRQVSGAGLGLAICKGFVEAHHGRVWVRSARPGAVFGFTLPVEGACEE